ncbi:MAG: hypothetical protein GF403_02335 [Candidatus Coatesbacteria bacterium]|nr:hypothetical protein [Candidatus Coatesbacteria bacterium]
MDERSIQPRMSWIIAATMATLLACTLVACTRDSTSEVFARAEEAKDLGRYEEAIELYERVSDPELAESVENGLRTCRAMLDVDEAERALRNDDLDTAVYLFCRPRWILINDNWLPDYIHDRLDSLRRRILVAIEKRLSEDPRLLDHPDSLLPPGLDLVELGILPQGLERTIRHYRAWGFLRSGDVAAAWAETGPLRSIGGVYEADRLREELEGRLESIWEDLPRESYHTLAHTLHFDQALRREDRLEIEYELITPRLSRQPPGLVLLSVEPPGYLQLGTFEQELIEESGGGPTEPNRRLRFRAVYHLEEEDLTDEVGDRVLIPALRIAGRQRAFKNLRQLLGDLLPLARLEPPEAAPGSPAR